MSFIIDESNDFNNGNYLLNTSTSQTIYILNRKPIVGTTMRIDYYLIGSSRSTYSNWTVNTSGIIYADANFKINIDDDNNYYLQTFGTDLVRVINVTYESKNSAPSEASLDLICSHLAEINWPYPTGTVHFHDFTYLNLNDLDGTPRYAGEDVGEGNECVTTVTNVMPAYKRDNSGTLTWNTSIVDTSKSNSYAINKTSTYIDIKGIFYPKSAITTQATYTFATVDATTIDYNTSLSPVYYGYVWNDSAGSFSNIYLQRAGSNGDAGNLQLRGMCVIKKSKDTSGMAANTATVFQIRIIPNFYNTVTNSNLRGKAFGQRIQAKS